MSMEIFPSSSAAHGPAMARLFGEFIAFFRESLGRSVEEGARRAGIEPAAWAAIEAGQVPRTRKRLADMAKALDLDPTWLMDFVRFFGDAWGKRVPGL
jgi:transcriptional regulator with XRE-family HTH domain